MSVFPMFARKIRVELTSVDPAKRISEINCMGIPVENLQKSGDLTVNFTLLQCHLKKVKSITDRRGDRIDVISQKGFYWTVIGLVNRPIILMGMILLLLSTLILPNLVLFVCVAGNSRVPEALIREIAQDAGIKFGTLRREIRSEKVKNQLLDEIPQLQWAGVNTSGCTATITVKERSVSEDPKGKYMVSNIVASCDGVISSCTVTSGTAAFAVGQAVKKGQLLVAGYTDCGNYVIAERAEGEIFATTRHQMRVVTPLKHVVRGEVDHQIVNFSLCIGKNRINLYKGSGIYDGSCVKMETRYQLTLPGGFKLPVVLIPERLKVCYLENSLQNQDSLNLSSRLSAFIQSQLLSDGVARSIVDAQEQYIAKEGIAVFDAVYECIEMIGREQMVQIGDFHGKTD